MDMLRSASDETRFSPSKLPSSTFSSLEPEPHDSPDDALELLAKSLLQQPFTTPQGLRKSLERRQQELQENKSQDQYLVFTSVPPAQYPRLSEDGSRISKFCRLFFNSETGILIAKVMPNIAHEYALGLFDLLITRELLAMNLADDIEATRSVTTQIGNWKKEADSSWTPTAQIPRPTFVVEIGLSESTQHLALDAHDWLETPSSSVNLLVTIDIARQMPHITLRRWELTPRVYGVQTRSNPPTARRTAFVTLSRVNNATTVTGEVYVNGIAIATTQLCLPFDKIAGRSPRLPLERDLVLSGPWLRTFGEKIWSAQGLM